MGRVAVAPCAVLWDVGGQFPFACRCCSVVGAPVAGIWPPVWVLEVSDLVAVFYSKDLVLYLLAFICSPYKWCLQELSSTSLRRNINPGSLSVLIPKEFFLTVYNF